jgi:sensor c-di-GMP phosphodiesterase-like protein
MSYLRELHFDVPKVDRVFITISRRTAATDPVRDRRDGARA